MQECKLREHQPSLVTKDYKSTKPDIVIAVVFSIWIAGTFAARLFSEIYFKENAILKIMITSLALLWPFMFFLFTKYRTSISYGTVGDKVSLGLFFVFGLLSCTVSPIMFQSTAFFVITIFAIYIILLFKSNISPGDMAISLQFYSFITILILLMIVKYDYAPGYRLGMRTGILNPNSIGLIAMSVVITASAIKYQIIRYPIILVAIGVIYLTGSRAAMLASIIGFVVVNKYRVDAFKTSQKVLFWISFFAIAGVVTAYYFTEIIDALESFFLFSDKHRGLSSGGSGRTIIWGWMWDLFVENPVFGVGYRAHGELITASSAHNGYLATLVDIGLVGFVSIMYLILVGVYRLWKKLSDVEYLRTYTTLFSLVAAYMALAMFERYLINVGNPASLLFMFAVLGRFRDDSKNIK